jgi:hypothetical protein
MAEEYSFPPYGEEVQKVVDLFGGEKMETYRGKDLKPLWDLTGGPILWSHKYLFKAPKLEKIVVAVQSFRDKLMSYMCIIWPEDEYALPVFSSFWAESEKGSYFIVDTYPLADCICDIEYMEKYLDPFEDLHASGRKKFPELSTRDPNWFLAMVSPYYITADFHPSNADTQNALLGLTTDYLKLYHSMWEKEEPGDPKYLARLNERKEAIRYNLREKDPGGFMIEQAVGKEIADLSLSALF